MDKVVASVPAALEGIGSGASLSVGGLIPGKMIKGLGGGIGPGCKVRRRQEGESSWWGTWPRRRARGSKVVNACSLPITGRGVAERIITDQCVFHVTDQGLVLRELAPGVAEEYVRTRTEPDFIVDLS